MPMSRRPGSVARGHSVLSSQVPAIGLAAASFSLVLTAASEVSALSILELSGSARWLYNANLSEGDSNLSSAGLGLSAGVTLPASLYLGASFQYFIGTEQMYTYVNAAGSVVAREAFSSSSFQLLGHVGYDAGLLDLTLRPSLGLGWWRTSVEADCFSCTPAYDRDAIALSPGVEILYSLGLLSVSAEARLDSLVFTRGKASVGFASIFGLGAGVSW